MPTHPLAQRQRAAFERHFSFDGREKFDRLSSAEPLIAYVRDFRLRLAVTQILRRLKQPLDTLTALCVCGGFGSDATFLANAGFKSVTVADISWNGLKLCRHNDRRLLLVVTDSEELAFAAESFDIVLVQDGLHHLPRPFLGLTEMLRVARRAVVILEPPSWYCHAALRQRVGDQWRRCNLCRPLEHGDASRRCV